MKLAVKKLSVLSVLISIALFTGCSPQPVEDTTTQPVEDATAQPSDASNIDEIQKHVVAADDITLDDAELALIMIGPPRHKDELTGQAYLALINPQGKTRLLHLPNSLDGSHPVWDSYGLHFGDRDYDYKLSDTLKRIRAPKRGKQIFNLAAGHGKSVSSQNIGFTDPYNYITDIGISRPDSSQRYTVNGNYFMGGICNGELYAPVAPFGSYLNKYRHWSVTPKSKIPLTTAEYLTPYGFTVQMVAQLTGKGIRKPKILSAHRTRPSDYAPGTMPCKNNILYQLSHVRAEKVQTDALRVKRSVRTFNISTGKYTEKILRNEKGHEMPMDDDLENTVPWSHRGDALKGNQLDWVSGDGNVYRTDPTSGKTKAIFSLPTVEKSQLPRFDRYIRFTRTKLASLAYYPAQNKLYIELFRRSDGKLVRKTHLPVIDKLQEVGYVYYDYAIKPDQNTGE